MFWTLKIIRNIIFIQISLLFNLNLHSKDIITFQIINIGTVMLVACILDLDNNRFI